MKATTLLLLSAALILWTGRAEADLVLNGSFESGDFTSWDVTPNPGPPFVFVTGSFNDAVALNPYDGNFFAALGFNTDPGFPGIGTVSQTLATTPGQDYLVRFAYLAEAGTPNSFTATFGSDTLFVVNDDLSNTGNNPAVWSYQQFVVTATSASTLLAFTSNNNPFYDALDAVSVNAIPEPSTFALLGLAIAGGGIWLRRRRRPAA